MNLLSLGTCLLLCFPILGLGDASWRSRRHAISNAFKARVRPLFTPPTFPTPIGRSPLSTAPRSSTVEVNPSVYLEQNSLSLNCTVACVTWNLQEMTPSLPDCMFLQPFRDKDIIVVGVQECESMKPRRSEGKRSKALSRQVQSTLGATHLKIAVHKMGGLQLFVYMKDTLAKEVQGLQLMGVPCGAGNVLTNKGAVCVLLRIKNKSLVFINAHLTAHAPRLRDRNMNFHRIRDAVIARADELFLPSRPGGSTKSIPEEKGAPPPVLSLSSNNDYVEKILSASGMPRDKTLMPFEPGDCDTPALSSRRSGLVPAPTSSTSTREGSGWPFDAVFFFGDLNYRLRGVTREQMDSFAARVRRIEKRLQASTGAPRTGKSIDDISHRAGNMRVSDKSSLSLLRRVLRFDQLTEERRRRRAFSGFKEGSIGFLPTYKYDCGEAVFDSSEKKRCPGWTDRVLFWTGTAGRAGTSTSKRSRASASARASASSSGGNTSPLELELVEYTSFDVRHSDHRPVAATFCLS